MSSGLSTKTYVTSVLFLIACIALPYIYLNFIAPNQQDYDFSLAPSLKSIPQENKILTLDSSSYNTITSDSRNYAVFIVLTALDPKVGCSQCGKFHSEYKNLPQAWLKNNQDYPLYFANLDFKNGMDVFQKLKLAHVPQLYLFLPKTGKYAVPKGSEDVLDFMKSGAESLSPDTIAEWISSSIKQPFEYSKPTDPALVLVVGALASIAILLIKWVFYGFSFILMNRTLWLSLTMFFVLLMTSGFMWNQIRNAPFATVDRNGRGVFILPQYSQQFEAETYLIAFLHFACALCTVLLSTTVPKRPANVQRILAFFLLAVLVIAYSCVIRVFLVKNAGYPLSLL